MSFRNRIVYSIKLSVSFLSDCASIPARRIVSIALLIVLRKIRKSFITALLVPLDFVVFGTELLKCRRVHQS